jgi:hypothetical protein
VVRERWIRKLAAAFVVAASFVAGLATRPRAARIEPRPTDTISVAPSSAGDTDTDTRRVAPAATSTATAAPAPTPAEDVAMSTALGRSLKDLFVEQVRDDAWATPREKFLRTEIVHFFSLVLPEAEELEIECKQSTCKIAFVVAADRAEVALSREQAMPIAEVLQPWDEWRDDGRVRVGLYVGYGPEMHALDRLVAFYREQYHGRFGYVPEDELVHYFELEEARRREEAP